MASWWVWTGSWSPPGQSSVSEYTHFPCKAVGPACGHQHQDTRWCGRHTHLRDSCSASTQPMGFPSTLLTWWQWNAVELRQLGVQCAGVEDMAVGNSSPGQVPFQKGAQTSYISSRLSSPGSPTCKSPRHTCKCTKKPLGRPLGSGMRWAVVTFPW